MKNTEIEVKFQLDRNITDEIKKLNFKEVSYLDQKDTYYKNTVRDGLDSHGSTYLRVRTSNGISSTAQHIKQKDYTWTEIESQVSDGDNVRLIYHNLGFDLDYEVHKKRRVFTSEDYPKVELVLDSVANLGLFLEIEAADLDTIWSIANSLKLTREQADKIKDLSYVDLVKATS